MVYQILSVVLLLALVYVAYTYLMYRYEVNRMNDINDRIRADQESYTYLERAIEQINIRLYDVEDKTSVNRNSLGAN